MTSTMPPSLLSSPLSSSSSVPHTSWTLTPKGLRRFKHGHPWVFSNDLAHSPKGHMPGHLVALHDPQKQFLAWGYGNPHSLIAFRTLTKDPHVRPDHLWVWEQLKAASYLRHRLGMLRVSHRLVFSEGDGLPGLIVDCFREHTSTHTGTSVWSCQINTAGMETLCGDALPELLMQLAHWQHAQGLSPWLPERTHILVRKDSSFRAMEGLPTHPILSIGLLSTEQLNGFTLTLPGAGGADIPMKAHLWNGQKTGFFLDQAENIRHTLHLLELRKEGLKAGVQVLDLCCYVGQWSCHTAAWARTHQIPCLVTLVDASQQALTQAHENVLPFGPDALMEKQDVLTWPGCKQAHYDLVICDPPAFVKRYIDLAPGLKAYVKINERAMAATKPGGLLVSCSCSGNVSDTDFQGALTQAMARSNTSFRWLYLGSQSPDHPRRLEFPEGTYLKCWIGERIR